MVVFWNPKMLQHHPIHLQKNAECSYAKTIVYDQVEAKSWSLPHSPNYHIINKKKKQKLNPQLTGKTIRSYLKLAASSNSISATSVTSLEVITSC